MSALFSPYSLGQLTLKNRITIAPMCQYSAHDGNASDWHVMHLGGLALSGAGMLTIEATSVESAGRISPGDLGLYSDANEAALSKVIQSVRRYSSMPIAVQLAHAGRKASTGAPWHGGKALAPTEGGWEIFSASAQAYDEHSATPTALDKAGLVRVREAFVQAALRAQRIGFDAIELHAAHGYLMHQFLSPLSNQRDDEYGGSLENRMRFPLEVFSAIRAALPADSVIGIRVSATDWVAGGWEIEQCLEFAKAMKAAGASFIHVSSGGLSPLQKIAPAPNYQVSFAEQIRAATGLTTIAVGMITEAEQAEAIIRSGQADLVALARTMMYNPHWPWHAAAKLGASVEVPPQYLRSNPAGMNQLLKPMLVE